MPMEAGDGKLSRAKLVPEEGGAPCGGRTLEPVTPDFEELPVERTCAAAPSDRSNEPAPEVVPETGRSNEPAPVEVGEPSTVKHPGGGSMRATADDCCPPSGVRGEAGSDSSDHLLGQLPLLCPVSSQIWHTWTCSQGVFLHCWPLFQAKQIDLSAPSLQAAVVRCFNLVRAASPTPPLVSASCLPLLPSPLR